MKIFLFVLILSALLFTGESYGQKPLKVIATNSLVADWVKQVGGDHVHITTLVGANGDVHTYEPNPKDIFLFSEVDLIFEIGFGLEHWMGKLAVETKAKRISLAKRAVKQPLLIDEGVGFHHHKEIDPHVWHNVRYVIAIVKNINRVLQEHDPASKAIYEQNAQAYLNELQELDQWLMKETSLLPKNLRKIISNHDTFAYWCERYQFECMGSVFHSFTTEAEDPSARDIGILVFRIKNSKVPAIFQENMTQSRLVKTVAEEAKVKIGTLYTDALGEVGSEADTYIKMMKTNMRTFQELLHE